MTGPADVIAPGEPVPPDEGERRGRRRVEDHLIQRDNSYGTPEEDAFRRDFTVNALFYDIGTFSIIDYVGGLKDLEARLIRSIGDPEIRFLEDPVRMLRAVVLASRLEFRIDEPILEAIALQRHEIARAAPARLLEEYYKILRSGYAEASFRNLSELGLLELMTPELRNPSEAVWNALAQLDAYRRRFESVPPTLNNTILVSALLVPAGLITRRQPGAPDVRVQLGQLPVARRDLDRLGQVLTIAPRLMEPDLPARLQRSLPMRPAFGDTLNWLDVFGDAPDVVMRWREQTPPPAADAGADGGRKRRRRRGRRRGRGRKSPAGVAE